MFIFLQLLIRKLTTVKSWLLFLTSGILVLVSTTIMRWLEPATFPTFFDSFWWTMTTVTTVGYGDYYPVTLAGRLLAVFLFLFGIGLIGVLITKLIDSWAVLRGLREEGKMRYLGKNHLVLFGWSRKAKHAIDEVLEYDKRKEIVLIATLEKIPYIHQRVHYIQGDAVNVETLEKGNVSKSSGVIIFAEEDIKHPHLADARSLMIATALERYTGDLHITVEVLEEKHIELFRHVSVDEFVVSDEMISQLTVHAALSAGTTELFNQLLSKTNGDDVYKIKPDSRWNTYRDAYLSLAEKGITLIGNQVLLNIAGKLDQPINENDVLFVICNKDAYGQYQQNI
ncbi:MULTISPECIES: potassium channel protein [Bacillus]|uniref:potassium channel protein n=1 Tax=Bacillus TaxID=1386 RepID=UPI000367066B|nr:MULTISPECIES: potassium channel protein [Bacillus]